MRYEVVATNDESRFWLWTLAYEKTPYLILSKNENVCVFVQKKAQIEG
jgi:hypothetical protein